MPSNASTIGRVRGVRVKGRTLVERIDEDKTSWCISGDPPLGPKYYNDLREAYQDEVGICDQLQIQKDEPKHG